MKGKFYVIGVGPGDPELLTLKAIRILNDCPVWVVPKGSLQGESTALNIIGDTVSRQGKEVLEQYFPMKKIHRGKKADPAVAKAWRQTAEVICERLAQGQDVVFPTLGDPAIYSTGFYVCETLLEIMVDLEIEIIPGVSSIGASAAAVGQPLCLGDERLQPFSQGMIPLAVVNQFGIAQGHLLLEVNGIAIQAQRFKLPMSNIKDRAARRLINAS